MTQISAAATTFFLNRHLPFIDGKFFEMDAPSFEIDDSATGEVVAEVVDGGVMAIDAAVAVARRSLAGP